MSSGVKGWPRVGKGRPSSRQRAVSTGPGGRQHGAYLRTGWVGSRVRPGDRVAARGLLRCGSGRIDGLVGKTDCEPGLALMQGRGVSCTVPERTLLTA